MSCRYGRKCEITKHTRLNCTACRLTKCFAIGMDPDFIRIFDQTAEKRQAIKETSIYTLDLLNTDRSSLTNHEWTMLSNVIHAYDKFDPTSKVIDDARNLHILPRECLFDSSHTHNLFTTYYTTARLFLASSADYKVLTVDEQCSLLKRNLTGLFIFCAEITCRDLDMLNDPLWNHTLTYTLGSDLIERKRYLNSRLELDTTLIKFMLIIIAFSSNCFMLDERQTIRNDHLLYGTFRLLGSQNAFVEILWKYMLYRYGYRDTVLRFSQLVKQILDLISLVVNMYKSHQLHQFFVDNTIQIATSISKLNENNTIPLWGKPVTSK